ncbi:uncharacterized protein DMAD_04474 [Drosophila madeirensis]|uniref:Uncharacterized protein n=1 Tax=Drosophila madeirensis TaxID=30013 RepID=A0AAU9GB32_DROMD
MENSKDDPNTNWSQLALDLLLHDRVDKSITVDPELAKVLLNMCFGDAMDAIHGALAVAKAFNRKHIIKADLRMINYICSSDMYNSKRSDS